MGCAQMNPQNGAWLSQRSVSSFDSELSTPEAPLVLPRVSKRLTVGLFGGKGNKARLSKSFPCGVRPQA